MEEFDTEINSELFDTDLDNVGWEPEVEDDSDEQAKEFFGYE